MRIGELSRRTGVSASRIRFYETHAVLPKAVRGENGYREYPATAVKMLGLIDEAQQMGFSLSEIRNGLSEAAPDFPSRDAMVEALRCKLESIDQHLKDVRARRRQVARLLAELEGCTPGAEAETPNSFPVAAPNRTRKAALTPH